MNQLLYTANSLVRVDSLIIRIGLVVGLLTAIFLAAFNSTIGFIVLAAVIAMGIAHRAYLLKSSERRLMVPGLNETTANVSIAIALLMWLVIAFLILTLHGFAFDRIAISLLLIAFATWFGWGERLVFVILFILVIVLLLTGMSAPFLPYYQALVYEFFRVAVTEDFQGVRNWLSIPVSIAGCWAMYRYWRLAVADCATGSEKRLDYLIAQNLSTVFGFSTAGNIIDSDVDETPDGEIPKNRADRLARLLYGRTNITRLGYLWLFGFAGIAIGAMLYCRGNDEATAALNFFGGMLIFVVPLSLLSHRLPHAFRCAWILGISKDRVVTARRILLIIARKSIVFFAVVFFFLAVQSAVSLTHLSSALFLFLVLVGLSGCLLWVAARWYVFWSRRSGIGILIGGILFTFFLLGLATLSVLEVIPVLGEIPELTREMMLSVGAAPCLAGIALLAATIWFWCIYDAPRSLGNDYRLLE